MNRTTRDNLIVTTVILLLVGLLGYICIRAYRNEKRKKPTPVQVEAPNPDRLYTEVTRFYSKTHPRWWDAITEYQYKGHSYIGFGSQNTTLHAAHCSCFSTNK